MHRFAGAFDDIIDTAVATGVSDSALIQGNDVVFCRVFKLKKHHPLENIVGGGVSILD